MKLDELLRANRKLSTVYVLKDDLKHLWEYVYRERPDASGSSGTAGQSKPHRATEEVRRRLKKYLPGILAHCHWPLHTSLLEGINNKIKVIKRVAYGYRDDDYFSSKSEPLSPEIPDEPTKSRTT